MGEVLYTLFNSLIQKILSKSHTSSAPRNENSWVSTWCPRNTLNYTLTIAPYSCKFSLKAHHQLTYLLMEYPFSLNNIFQATGKDISVKFCVVVAGMAAHVLVKSSPSLLTVEVSSSRSLTFTIPHKFLREISGLLPCQSGITSISLLVNHSFTAFSCVTGGPILHDRVFPLRSARKSEPNYCPERSSTRFY